MEELINRIITIEDLAKAITNKAYENRNKIQQDIETELEGYKVFLQKKEEKMLIEMTKSSEQFSKEQREQMGRKYQLILKEIDGKFQENKENWEESVFQSVIQ